jgi:hypothetical protein
MVEFVKIGNITDSTPAPTSKFVKIGNINDAPVEEVDNTSVPDIPLLRASKGSLEGVPEVAATLITGAIAEPLAGLAGLFSGTERRTAEDLTKTIEDTRNALTFKPRSKAGKEKLQKLGKFFEPLGKLFEKVETGLGDKVFESTKSPALAAAATTIPTLITELVGAGAGKVAVKTAKHIKKIRSEGAIASAIDSAVPTKDQIKNTARAVYKEIDETGAVLNQQSYDNLVNKIDNVTTREGIDKDITRKSARVVARMTDEMGLSHTATELDTLRKVARSAARDLDPSDSRMGNIIIDEIDSHLDTLTNQDITVPVGVNPTDISKKFKIARGLWGRARRSELLDTAFENARLDTNFNNGLVREFKSLLKNKRTKKLFNASERAAMEKVVKTGNVQGIAQMVGSFGFTQSSPFMNLVRISAGGALGTAVGNPMLGVVALPLIGETSKVLAKRLMLNKGKFADAVIRSGKDAKKITAAYLDNTPKELFDPKELAQLLMKKDIDLSVLPDTELISAAKQLATENRASLAAVLAKLPTEEENE